MVYSIFRGIFTAAVAIIITIIYQIIKNKKLNTNCRKCARLQKLGGFWKYYCEDQPFGFDKAPSFCYKFKERKD